MRKKRVLVDVDEVLGDFQTPAFQVMQSVTGRLYCPEDFEVWDMFEVLSPSQKELVFAAIDKPGFCANIQPFPAALEAIERLRGIADVYALTSPHHSQSWYYERVEWLKKHFGFNRHHVIQTGTKFLVRGDAFLDDKPDHVQAWSEEHPDKLAMLWHIPNTRTLGLDNLRVRTWDEVIRRVEAITL